MKRIAPLLLVFCTIAVVRADVGPPPGKKAVPVTTTVVVIEDVPDYAFFATSYSSTPGPPPHGGTSRSATLHFFTPGTAIRATGDRRGGGTLYAVPRSVAEGVPSWKGFAADAVKAYPKHSTVSNSDESWFALARSVQKGEVPGATSVRFGGSAEVPTSDPRTAITETYQIVRTPTGVAFVNPDEPPSDGSRPTEGKPDAVADVVPWWRWVAAGAATFAAILVGGLWIAFRGRKA